MKRIYILMFILQVFICSVFAQKHIEDGDVCFENGDYTCAIAMYKKAFDIATGKDKQIAEIKLMQANSCSKNLKSADTAFKNNRYNLAKSDYQKILDINPKDSYAKLQLEKCNTLSNTPILRKATISDLADIWNNKYGTYPERRQKLINAGIDPDDAQRRINKGEGKPKEENQYTLSTSRTKLFFDSDGNTSTNKVFIFTNAPNYFVVTSTLPSWIKIEQFSEYITVAVEALHGNNDRSDWFLVTVKDKSVRIDVEQKGRKSSVNNTTSNVTTGRRNSESSDKTKSLNCFNCPKGDNTKWGVTIGYNEYYPKNAISQGYLVGLRFQPEFKYGFGLNIGLNYEKFNDYKFVIQDTYLFYPHDKYNILYDNISLNTALQYNFNLSKWFRPFVFSGMTLNYNFAYLNDVEKEDLLTFIDFGIGLKVNKLQFDITNSMMLDNVLDKFDFKEFYNVPDKLSFKLTLLF